MHAPSQLIEEGAPAGDGRAFRRCLGQFATGVTVMTARDGERLVGICVNSFAALSLEPPLVLWSIRRVSGSLDSFRAAGRFAVNVLAADQVALANLFASATDDKFGTSRWTPGRGGAPLLAGAIASLECRLEQVLDGGDHLIMVGRVEHYARRAGEPLLFAQGRYAMTQEHPGAAQPVTPAPLPRLQADDASTCSLLRLLHYASQRTSSDFAGACMAEGVSVAQYRILGWLHAQPYGLDALKHLAYLGGRDGDDTVAAMRERGELSEDAQGLLRLTATGRAHAQALARRAADFEAALVRDLAPQDVAATRRVLAALATRATQAETEIEIETEADAKERRAADTIS